MQHLNIGKLKLVAIGMAALLAVASGASSVTAAAKDFATLDKNNDGKLSKEESGLNDSEFAISDLDSNNSISQAEWTEYINASAIEAQIESARKHMVEFGGALRSHYLKYDHYPETLQLLVDRGHLDAIPLDPWGKAYQYSLKPRPEPKQNSNAPKPRVATPAGSEGVPEQPEAKPVEKKDLDFEILCLGRDGEAKTVDDITKTPTAVRMKVLPSARKRILDTGGHSHQLAKSALAYEQAYRLWMCIAESEYSTGEPVVDVETLTLPTSLFADGEATDVFGRPLAFKNVRGLRAIVADEIKGESPAITMTEADFAHMLSRRMSGERNYNWMVNQIGTQVRSFMQSKGRLPLTENEIVAFSNNNWLFSRQQGSVRYITVNDDRSYILFELGADQLPGGRNLDIDVAHYGPEDLAEADISEYGYWDNSEDTNKRYEALKAAMKAAIERKEKAEGKEPTAEAEASELDVDESMLAGLPPEMRDKVLEALEKARAAQKAVGAAGGGGGAAAPEAKPAEKKAEPAEKPVEPAEKPVDKPAETPSEKPADKPTEKPTDKPTEKPTEKPADEPSKEPADKPSESIGASNIYSTVPDGAARLLVDVLLAQDATEPAPKEADKPADAAVPEVAPVKPLFALKQAIDMIPARVYNDTEAVEKSIIEADDWQLSRMRDALNRFLETCTRYPQRLAGTDLSPPIGNITMPSNKHFWDNVGKDFADNMNWDEDIPRPHWIIARFELDDKRVVKSLVVIALPGPKSTMPIMVASRLPNGGTSKPLFASVKDQPEGWFDLVANCDGDPAKAKAEAGKADASKAEAPSEPLPPPPPVEEEDAAKPEAPPVGK